MHNVPACWLGVPEVRFKDLPDAHPVTKSAFVQVLHFLGLNWEDVKDVNPAAAAGGVFRTKDNQRQ